VAMICQPGHTLKRQEKMSWYPCKMNDTFEILQTLLFECLISKRLLVFRVLLTEYSETGTREMRTSETSRIYAEGSG
jgi:hypothetical protein